MKAISLWQPWASAIAVGLKAIETRSWPTPYRGLIAIHAAKRWTSEEMEFLEDLKEVWPEAYQKLPAAMPFGAIVAVAQLFDCRRIEHDTQVSDLERALGNYCPGRFAWTFGCVVPLVTPIAYRGMQGLFDVDITFPSPAVARTLIDATAREGRRHRPSAESSSCGLFATQRDGVSAGEFEV